MADIQLQPVPGPIGAFQSYISKRTETLILKEKMLSLTGDSFDICLANGQPLLRVQGQLASMSGRKKVYDIGGEYLFDIFKEYFHLHSTYAIKVKGQNKIMEVKSSFFFFGSKATATITSADGKHDSLVMHGKFFSTRAEIVDQASGAIVARIDRKLFTARQWLGGKQTYALVVAPGVDLALMAALCICLDEKNNEKQ